MSPEESTSEQGSHEIFTLATKAFTVMTRSMLGEVTEAVGKFSTLAEKGTVIFLQAMGAVLVVIAIVLFWRSESVFESLTRNFMERSNQQQNFSHPASPNFSEDGRAAPAVVVHPVSPEFKVQFGAPQFLILVSSGTLLMITGSIISVTTYRWRIETYRLAQRLDKDNFGLEVTLRQSGIQAMAEGQKAIGNVASSMPVQSAHAEPVVNPEPFK
jgi:hypothetical protein